MIRYFTFLLFSVCILQAELEVNGHFGLEAQGYLTHTDTKNSNSFTAKQTLEVNYTKEDLSVYAKLYAQEAYYDFTDTKDETQRTFFRLDELYLKYDHRDSSMQIGKSIKYWGALELRSIVDVFNPNELRDDLFKTNRLGVWNASYSYYTDSGELSVVLKMKEPKQRMAGFAYAYYALPSNTKYDENLCTIKGVNQPSLYISYSGSTDTYYALDYAFVYEHGYDSQRYFSRLSHEPNTYIQNAYIVDKFMTYNTSVIGATLLKLEALYAKVADNELISDYSHVAIGFEHALDDFKDASTLSVLSEYYKYTRYDSGTRTDLELFESMQDDIFIGLRYVLNNADDTELLGGIIHDLEYDEQTYYMELESRVADSFKVALDYYYIEPSKEALTANALLGRHQRVSLNIAYYF